VLWKYEMPDHDLSRRTLLGAAGLPLLGALGSLGLGGCASPLPLAEAPPAAGAVVAATLLQESAQAHGLAAFKSLSDINVAYQGQWRPLINGVQPEVVDAGYRGSSQERLMPALGINAQHYSGPKGSKFVAWRRGKSAPPSSGSSPGELALWFNDKPSADLALQQAAAVVAESYALFLLGPLWLLGRGGPVQRDGTERVDGRLCDVLQAWVSPGLGLSRLDRVTLCIDQSTRITRRMRFTLEGFASTQGAVAEVDTFDHETRFGVLWPMRSFERVVHPLNLPAHDWRIAGLDVNRGYGPEALTGPTFTGAAAQPARAL
jgi:hypothetical protein